MSDGSACCAFSIPSRSERQAASRSATAGAPVEHLNELEYVKGEIFANVWQTDTSRGSIPRTGRVTGWIDLRGPAEPADAARGVDVLNGIAYDAADDRLFVTGKLWPRIFEVKILH